jgi:hypothetical protein
MRLNLLYKNKFTNNNLILPVFVVAIIVLISINQLRHFIDLVPSQTNVDDYKYYTLMASGKYADCVYPFTVRILYPLLSGLISKITGMPLNWSFVLLSFLSLTGFVFLLTGYHKLSSGNALLGLLAFSPLLCYYFQNFYLPDIFYSFLLILFIITLKKEKIFFSSIILFLLFITKETSFLISMIILIIYWFRKNKKSFYIILSVTIFSLFFSYLCQKLGKPNIHHLNSGIYLVLKLIYNFLYNVTGIKLWTNTFLLVPCDPAYLFHLDNFHFLGNIKSVGICGFDIYRPIGTLCILSSVFGVLLVTLIIHIKKYKLKNTIKGLPIEVQFCFIYGIIMFVMGTSSGSWVYRLVGYGWPAFWITSAYLISINNFNKQTRLLIYILQFIFIWPPYFFGFYKYLQSPFLYLENSYLLIIFLFINCIALFFMYRYFSSAIITDKETKDGVK